MEPQELFGITSYLTLLYEDRFPTLTDAMTRVWYEELRHLPEDLVSQAVRRWARHHTLKAPTLDELLEQVELVRTEAHTARRSPSEASFADVLRKAAQRQAENPERSEAEATFSHLMCLIGERSCEPWLDDAGTQHARLTLEGRATQCYEWATHYQATQPALADDLRAAARTYAQVRWDEEQQQAAR